MITYLLTYSVVQSPSWEANWFAASQEIPRILWNPKVHYHTQKRPPPVSIVGQPNTVHIPTSHLLEIRPKSTHLRLGLRIGLFPSGFPTVKKIWWVKFLSLTASACYLAMNVCCVSVGIQRHYSKIHYYIFPATCCWQELILCSCWG